MAVLAEEMMFVKIVPGNQSHIERRCVIVRAKKGGYGYVGPTASREDRLSLLTV